MDTLLVALLHKLPGTLLRAPLSQIIMDTLLVVCLHKLPGTPLWAPLCHLGLHVVPVDPAKLAGLLGSPGLLGNLVFYSTQVTTVAVGFSDLCAGDQHLNILKLGCLGVGPALLHSRGCRSRCDQG